MWVHIFWPEIELFRLTFSQSVLQGYPHALIETFLITNKTITATFSKYL